MNSKDDFEANDSTEEGSCPTCGKQTKEGHACVLARKEDQKCDWCGALIAEDIHLCSDKEKEMVYKCSDCGRMAINADNLCSPKKM